MIYNGEIDTTQSTIFTVPPFTSGVEVTMLRVVNESGSPRTFTVFINTSGTAKAITPVETQLPVGACYDDFPLFQLRASCEIKASADAAGVSWTLNAVQL
jgi:hypothetical protein